MLKHVKALHLLGAILFFGSILGHVTVGFIPGVTEDPQTALFARLAIDTATDILTLPGLLLLLATGAFMILWGQSHLFKRRWLTLHAALGLVIALNAFLVLMPTGAELLAAATQAAAGLVPVETLAPLKGREAAFGAVNVLLCLLLLFLAVLKPRLGQKQQS